MKPFRFFCHKILPLTYDDSLSYYELLCKLVKYVNDLSSEVNSITDELTNYINNYFSSLDFQTMVNNKLDEYVTNGTFDNLLATVTNATLTNYLYNVHLFDITNVSGDNIIGSGFVIDDNYVYIAYNSADANSSAVCCIDRENLSIVSTCEITGSNLHINSLTKDNNYLYATDSNNALIYKISLSGYTLTSSISISKTVACCVSDDGYYVLNSDGNVTLYDSGFNSSTSIDGLNLYDYCNELQSLCIANNYLVFNTNQPTGVIFYNLSTKSVDRFLTNDSLVGEVEDIYFYDNNIYYLYIAYTSVNNVVTRIRGVGYYPMYLETVMNNRTNYTNYAIETPHTYYVDNTSTKSIETGTSAYPFKSINGALRYLQTHVSRYAKTYTLSVANGSYDENVNIIDNVGIRGSGETVINGDIYFSRCNAFLSDITVNNINTSFSVMLGLSNVTVTETLSVANYSWCYVGNGCSVNELNCAGFMVSPTDLTVFDSISSLTGTILSNANASSNQFAPTSGSGFLQSPVLVTSNGGTDFLNSTVSLPGRTEVAITMSGLCTIFVKLPTNNSADIITTVRGLNNGTEYMFELTIHRSSNNFAFTCSSVFYYKNLTSASAYETNDISELLDMFPVTYVYSY